MAGLPPEIPPEVLKPDWELLDRYQAYSAELVRLALLGITAVGSLLTLVAVKVSTFDISGLPCDSRWGVGVALIALGACAAAALLHRYVSADSMGYHVHFLRMTLQAEPDDLIEKARWKVAINDEKTKRDKRLKWSGRLLHLAAWCLAFGGLALAASVFAILVEAPGRSLFVCSIA